MSYRLHERGPRHEISQQRPGWITVRMIFDAPGDFVAGHAHAFAHDMTIESGAVSGCIDGTERVLSEGQTVTVPAHVKHGLRALKSGTVAKCEHEIRAENGRLMPDAFSPEGIPAEWVSRLVDAGDHFASAP